eukprot:GHRQ01010810.1.p1 GENE.GHRQ01010810.1~~GHRQ01010810.1.p1  ORF type:complete len:302 (+),score=126.20 GHRQ01010810.1:460-1365(+)
MHCRRVESAVGGRGFSSKRAAGVALQKQAARQLRHMVTASAGKRLVALDFDGVVCDSVGESSLSAIKAAAIQWPEIFQSAAAEAAKPQLVEQMRAVRPVVETGYENVVQVRCLYEGVTVQQMLESWHDILPAKMKEWSLDRSKLIELFGKVRDEWISEDLAGWLAPNRIYPGVAEAVAAAMQQDEVYIVTTKQAHYTETLLRDMAGIAFPADRILSTTVSGEPKSTVLAHLAEQHPGAAAYVFVEDKLSTLKKVAKVPGAEAWQLYLVGWGYNTVAERQEADADPRITVVGLQGFQKLMAQ